MPFFERILRSTEAELLQLLQPFNVSETSSAYCVKCISTQLKLNEAELICAIGFNQHIKKLSAISLILGFDNATIMVDSRNAFFTMDTYKLLGLKAILSIYSVIKNDTQNQPLTGDLLSSRLSSIEKKIEETVNLFIIENYKKEICALYFGHLVNTDFVESRLERPENGFRALLNEVTLIVKNGIIPIDDIFRRDSILTHEKKKLLNNGLVPKELVDMRLHDPSTPDLEKKILYDFITLNNNN